MVFPVGFRDGFPRPVDRRPTPIPTRTSVSSDARPLMSKSSSHSTTPFSKRTTMVEPPAKRTHTNQQMPSFWQHFRLTEREVPKLLATFDLFSFGDSCLDTADHHRANTNGHDTAELRTVNRNDLSNVFTIDIKSCPDSLWLNKEQLDITDRSQRILLTFTV